MKGMERELNIIINNDIIFHPISLAKLQPIKMRRAKTLISI